MFEIKVKSYQIITALTIDILSLSPSILLNEAKNITFLKSVEINYFVCINAYQSEQAFSTNTVNIF